MAFNRAGASGQLARTQAVQRREALLVESLYRYGDDLFVAMGLEHSRRVGPIGLVSQDVAAHVLRVEGVGLGARGSRSA